MSLIPVLLGGSLRYYVCNNEEGGAVSENCITDRILEVLVCNNMKGKCVTDSCVTDRDP